MKKSNYNKSISKWKGVIRQLKRAIKKDENVYLDLISPCGFCIEFSQGPDCGGCPLYPEFCESRRSLGESVFWQIVKADNECDYKKALELSERMLTKIETYSPILEKSDCLTKSGDKE